MVTVVLTSSKDDQSEIDIEIVTPGNSLVNDTIDYTSHPSLNADGTKIPNATLQRPLANLVEGFKIHRFDCSPEQGVQYYLDNELVHSNTRNVPHTGGSLQLKLWADGNKWWSGHPSKSDVLMHVKSIVAYYNTTTSGRDSTRAKECTAEKKRCIATYVPSHTDQKPPHPKMELSGSLPSSSTPTSSIKQADSEPAIASSRFPAPKDYQIKGDNTHISDIGLEPMKSVICTRNAVARHRVCKSNPTSAASRLTAMSCILKLVYLVVIVATNG